MTQRIWVKRPVAVYIGAVGLAASLAISSCYNGDQSCGEAYNPNDLSDHCPYGPPGGPKPGAFPSDCPPIETRSGDQCTGANWAAVYAVLLQKESGNCTNAGIGCHTNQVVDVAAFVGADGVDDGGILLLDSLSKYTGSFGNAYPTVKEGEAIPRLYYDRAEPAQSWWLCNLRGDAGSLMPSGKPRMSEADIELLEQWLACGAADDPGR